MKTFWIGTLLFILSCSANASFDPVCWLRNKSPNDHIVEGPFEFGPTWRNILLLKPFKTSPHVHSVEILLNPELFQQVEVMDNDKTKPWIGAAPKRKTDQALIFFDVEVKDRQNRWIKLHNDSIGISYTPLGNFRSIGFGHNPNTEILYYPKDLEITQLRIKSQVPVRAEHIQWIAPRYSQAPCRDWEDLNAKNIFVP